jgi:hypothetical protein
MGYPGLYTNVYYFLDWINENIWHDDQKNGAKKIGLKKTYDTMIRRTVQKKYVLKESERNPIL